MKKNKWNKVTRKSMSLYKILPKMMAMKNTFRNKRCRILKKKRKPMNKTKSQHNPSTITYKILKKIILRTTRLDNIPRNHYY